MFLGLLLSQVLAVVIALHVLENGFHFLCLLLPFFLVHLGLATEKLLIGHPVAASQAIPEGSELSVVVVEVEMVHGVAGSSVDHGAVGNIFTIVDQDGPEVDETEEENICELLEREDKREQVVRHTLRPAIKRVERMRCKGTRHDPLVVRLVQSLIDQGVVQASVNPVNAEIGERDEQRELNEAVKPERLLVECIVQFGVTTDLCDQERGSQKRHNGH